MPRDGSLGHSRDIKPGRGRGRDAGFEHGQETHADRAARLLELARSAHSSRIMPDDGGNGHIDSPRPALQKPRTVSSDSAELSSTPIPLPSILKSLANPALGAAAFPVREAIPLAGKIVRAKLNNQISLAHLNGPVLEEAGITSELERHKILTAFGVRALKTSAASTSAASEAGPSRRPAPSALSREAAKAKRSLEDLVGKQSSAKRRRQIDDEQLSREYGNVTMPKAEAGAGDQSDYFFNEVLDISALHGRFVYVNRAPIMTAWTAIVLERLGFQRREALSLSHCYVHTTSTSRGISLGIIPSSERNRSVNFIGANQPHFELMGVKIPLMKLHEIDEWRGISQGQVIGPDQAFSYIRKSMHQTLPLVIGSLMLLADSFVNTSEDDILAVKREQSDRSNVPSDIPSPDLLHARAYELYTLFRPATAGEWGKKSMFYCDKALALRRGHENDWAEWLRRHGDESNDAIKSEPNAFSSSSQTAEQQQAEARAFEEELQRLVDGGDAGQTFVVGPGEDLDDDDKSERKPAT